MQFKIQRYLQKTVSNRIAKNYRYFITGHCNLAVSYFFWLNIENYAYTNVGYCVKKAYKKHYHMDSFIVYYFLRNMRINQFFFTNLPFLFLLKKRFSEQKNQKVFLL